MIAPALSRAVGVLPLPLAFAVLAWPQGLLSMPAALALWWLGRELRGATGALLPALLAQAAFVSPIVPPPLALAALVFVAAALPSLLHRPALPPRAHQVILAVAAGALVLTLMAGSPAAAMPAAPFVLVPVWAASLLALSVYFRLRRRGLMQQDRFARLMALVLAVQGVAVALHQWTTALVMAGTALAALWSLSRPLLPMSLHHRIWIGVLVVLLGVQSVQGMVVTTPPP